MRQLPYPPREPNVAWEYKKYKILSKATYRTVAAEFELSLNLSLN